MSRKKPIQQFDIDEFCVHDEVMKHLHDDKVTMRPRFHFIVGSLLVGIGIAGTIVVSVFFTHVIVYRLRAEHVWGYAGFGAHGLLAFIQFFPWLALLLALCGLISGSYLLKQYDFGCKHRLTRVLIASVALVLSFGLLLEHLHFGEKMAQYSAIENMYRRQAPVRIISGRIVDVAPHRVIVESDTGALVNMDSTRIEKAVVLRSGMHIQALGRWERDLFHIQKIRIISVK